MGLDCSHNAFSGAYSAFNRLRGFLCYVVSIITKCSDCSFPPHLSYKPPFEIRSDLDPDCFYVPDNFENDHPGLWHLLAHDDCDGEIPPDICSLVADDLDWILPTAQALKGDLIETGHIARDGGYEKVIAKFRDGCRDAASHNEPLIFR